MLTFRTFFLRGAPLKIDPKSCLRCYASCDGIKIYFLGFFNFSFLIYLFPGLHNAAVSCQFWAKSDGGNRQTSRFRRDGCVSQAACLTKLVSLTTLLCGGLLTTFIGFYFGFQFLKFSLSVLFLVLSSFAVLVKVQNNLFELKTIYF